MHGWKLGALGVYYKSNGMCDALLNGRLITNACIFDGRNFKSCIYVNEIQMK